MRFHFATAAGSRNVQHQLQALSQVAPQLALHTLQSPWSELQGHPGTAEVVPCAVSADEVCIRAGSTPVQEERSALLSANFGPLISEAPLVLSFHDARYYFSWADGEPGSRLLKRFRKSKSPGNAKC